MPAMRANSLPRGRLILLCACLLICWQPAIAQQPATQYVCPMHSEVRSTSPGRCPKCRMLLRADQTKAGEDGASALSARSPDTVVYDQEGRQLRFFTDLVKGRTVAINFIFTTCTTICPPLTATFRKVQQQLGERVGRDVALISVSVDPVTDVPERLRSFAAKFDAGPGWSFITGSPPEIEQLLRALGASVGDKNDHTPLVLVGNEAAGYWKRTSGLARPAQLVAVITEAAARAH